MEKELSDDSITLTKGANSKIRKWFLKHLGGKKELFMPSLKNVVLTGPYVKESSKEVVMKL